MFQFICETVLLMVISIGIAIIFGSLFLPWLNQFTNKEIPLRLLMNPGTGLLLFGFALLVGLVAGFYPALVLSGFKPVNVLKGRSCKPGTRKSFLVKAGPGDRPVYFICFTDDQRDHCIETGRLLTQ